MQTLRLLEKWYVVDITSEVRAWSSAPEMRPVGRTTMRGGRPTQNEKPLTKPRPVDELAAEIPVTAWKRVPVAEGSQGPRLYEYAELTMWFSEESLPTAKPERLLVRRSLDQSSEVKYQRSNAPESIPLRRVAEVAGCRWCVEQDFQCDKGECGLDEYETRGWTGWHHHTALSMLALWFLTLQRVRLGEKYPQLSVPEVRAVLVHLLDRRAWDEREILHWSRWRQERNRIARACHERRRAEQRRRSRRRKQAL